MHVRTSRSHGASEQLWIGEVLRLQQEHAAAWHSGSVKSYFLHTLLNSQ